MTAGQAEGRRLHRDARPRHRLGRRRSRGQSRRAEGRVPHHAADRPRQPPHGRALEGLSRADEPLRDPGMPGGARRGRGRGAGHARPARRRARRAGPARPRHGLRRARSTLEALYDEVRSAAPYADLTWEDFEAVVDFVATGGYALRAYERFAKILRGPDGLWRVRDGRVAQQYRLNVGTIVDGDHAEGAPRPRLAPASPAPSMPQRGRVLGEVEEGFCEIDDRPATPSSSRARCCASRASPRTRCSSPARRRRHRPEDPDLCGLEVPALDLPGRPRAAAPGRSGRVGPPADGRRRRGCASRSARSVIPAPGDLLVETFPRQKRHYLVAFPFEGRLAHQTLGMLLTRRLERARPAPARLRGQRLRHRGLVPAATSARAAAEPGFLDDLFGEDMLGDDLEDWLDESAMMKRTFRDCAVIAGLIERRHPGAGEDAAGRSPSRPTSSTTCCAGTSRTTSCCRAARADAATGLLDVRRLGAMLARIRGRIRHKAARPRLAARRSR